MEYPDFPADPPALLLADPGSRPAASSGITQCAAIAVSIADTSKCRYAPLRAGEDLAFLCLPRLRAIRPSQGPGPSLQCAGAGCAAAGQGRAAIEVRFPRTSRYHVQFGGGGIRRGRSGSPPGVRNIAVAAPHVRKSGCSAGALRMALPPPLERHSACPERRTETDSAWLGSWRLYKTMNFKGMPMP